MYVIRKLARLFDIDLTLIYPPQLDTTLENIPSTCSHISELPWIVRAGGSHDCFYTATLDLPAVQVGHDHGRKVSAIRGTLTLFRPIIHVVMWFFFPARISIKV